jgi:hypothetical protein
MHIKPYLAVILFFCFFDLTAQKGSLSIVVDKDTMFEDEVVKVELLLENTQGSYSPPTFEGFRISWRTQYVFFIYYDQWGSQSEKILYLSAPAGVDRRYYHRDRQPSNGN